MYKINTKINFVSNKNTEYERKCLVFIIIFVLFVILFCKNTNERTVSVHRLVATAFVEGRTELRNEVDHVDGVKEHNYASNLEWVSRSEQILRAYKLGLIKPILGEDKDNAVYSNEFIIKLCGYMELGMSSPELAEHMGVEKTKSFQWLVDGIRSKNRWVFISRNFNIPRFKEERNIWVEPIVRDTAYKISKNVPRDIIFGFLYGLFTHRSEKCINTFIDDIQFKRRYTEITDEYF